ncbi:hypothetical protein FRC11_011298 [Ceratobasidium sp. 423]|nr:hypothetical protein FRC11_011298 [Ceratobasidium sp. 423]
MSNLRRTYRQQRRLVEAKVLLETALSAQKRVAGEEHPDQLKTMHYLAVTLYRQRQFTEAEILLTMVVTARKLTLGEDHPNTLESMHMDDLGSVYDGQNRLVKAEELSMTVMATRKRILGKIM